MTLLNITSIFLLVFSVILIIKPSLIFELNRRGNKIIFTDSEFFSMPKFSGSLFIIVGVVIIFLGYYIKDMVSIIITNN